MQVVECSFPNRRGWGRYQLEYIGPSVEGAPDEPTSAWRLHTHHFLAPTVEDAAAQIAAFVSARARIEGTQIRYPEPSSCVNVANRRRITLPWEVIHAFPKV